MLQEDEARLFHLVPPDYLDNMLRHFREICQYGCFFIVCNYFEPIFGRFNQTKCHMAHLNIPVSEDKHRIYAQHVKTKIPLTCD